LSTHESVQRDETIEPGSDRNFGLIVGGILAAIGIYQLTSGSELSPWFIGCGVLLMVLGLIAPGVLHPLNRAWTHLGIMLGRIVTPIVMFIVYVISVVPIGLLLRLFGKNPLALQPDATASSYWIKRVPPGPPPEGMKDQF
jgi:hypothetical protein